MNIEQQRAILSVALLAAFADNANDAREREQIRRLAESLSNTQDNPDLADLYRQVLMNKVTLQQAAAQLLEPAHRQLAYEMAVCVCDADGRMNAAEEAFLADLAQALAIDTPQAQTLAAPAQAMAELTENMAVPKATSTASASASVITTPAQSAAMQSARARPSDAELDQTIFKAAILNGALELLPQSWASMAIIPLQIKMVYGIGKAHGYELDQGHIRDFLATLGVGLTSQYLEQFGRKLLGGLLGSVAGGLGKTLGKSATSMTFSFATTYALGHVAKRYYASDRQMSTELLKESFQSFVQPAKNLQTQYLPQMQQTARNLDMGQIMDMVRR